MVPLIASWSKEAEFALVHFLVEHKAEAGDNGKFKDMTWTAAADEMAKYHEKGAVKTAKMCKGKWARLKVNYQMKQIRLVLDSFDNKPGTTVVVDDAAWQRYIAMHPNHALAAKGLIYEAMKPLMPKLAPRKIASCDRVGNQGPIPQPGSLASVPGTEHPRDISMDQGDAVSLSGHGTSSLRPSASAIGSHKRKSVLESDESGLTEGLAGKRRKTMTSGPLALKRMADQLQIFNNMFSEVFLAGENKSYTGVMERRVMGRPLSAKIAIRKAPVGPVASVSPIHGFDPAMEHRSKEIRALNAAELLLREEIYLTPDRQVALLDLFRKSSEMAGFYSIIVNPTTRKLWIKTRLTELGFPADD